MGRPSKLAMALSGGGFTGYLFEIGALTALDDLFDDGVSINDFDLFVGVSAGAAAAMLMANGVKPEEILQANLSDEWPYYFERRDIFTPAMGEGLKTVWRGAKQLFPLLKLYVQNRHEMSLIDLLDKAQDALPSGIYTLEPFARHLEATCLAKGLSNSFDGLRKELYIPAIDLETGQGVVFGDWRTRAVPISRAITASCAAPIYFCPVRIDGRDYIDAGIGRITFFEVAAQKGADFMIIINPSVHIRHDLGTGGMRPPSVRTTRLRDKGFLSIGDQATRINLEARFSQALRMFRHEHPEKDFLVISPKPTETLLFERSFLSFRDRVHLLRCGYLSVVEAIQERGGEVQARFSRHGLVISESRLRQRVQMRLEQLAGTASAVPPAPAKLAPRAGWSSVLGVLRRWAGVPSAEQ